MKCTDLFAQITPMLGNWKRKFWHSDWLSRKRGFWRKKFLSPIYGWHLERQTYIRNMCRTRAYRWKIAWKYAVNITDLIKKEFKYRQKSTEVSSRADNKENPGIGFDSIIGLVRSHSQFVTGFLYICCCVSANTKRLANAVIAVSLFFTSQLGQLRPKRAFRQSFRLRHEIMWRLQSRKTLQKLTEYTHNNFFQTN